MRKATNIQHNDLNQPQFKKVNAIDSVKIEKTPLKSVMLKEPLHKTAKNLKVDSKKSSTNQNNIYNKTEKCVIYCPEERVKQYANIIKNSQMEQMAVIPKQNRNESHKNTFSKIILLLVVGILIGFVNGFFGGGGGMICVPLLIFCLGLKDKESHATAILIMLSISLVSIFIYLTNFEIDYEIALYVVIGSVVGGIIGSLLLKRLSNLWIRLIFALIMIFAGINIIW